MHEVWTVLWANLYPILITFAVTAICTALPTIFATQWYAKTGTMGQIFKAAVMAAVERRNRDYVDAVRSDPGQAPIGKLPESLARDTRRSAVEEVTAVLDAAARTVGGPAGEVVQSLVPLVGDAIDATVEAVKAAKNPNLPTPSANALADAMK